MFTHKRTEAWDTLTTALIEAGFIVTATHPVNTESGYSLHQKDKNAAKSTILLASEKRPQTQTQPTLWSDIRTETRQVARAKAAALDASGDDYTRVDIILASFGDTLEVFTRNYPVVDDTGEPVRPQVALDEAREAVRDYLIAQYLDEGVREVDPVTEWYLMAWLVFEARRFPYDEANRLGKGLGIEVDAMKNQHRLWRKRSSDVVLRSYDERVQTQEDKERSRTVKPVDPAALVFDTDLDKVHATMYHYDRQGLRETETYITERGFDTDLAFRATVETLLRVLPSNHPTGSCCGTWS
jgi:Adenine-specific DNA methylase containing a Zn-ribbon